MESLISQYTAPLLIAMTVALVLMALAIRSQNRRIATMRLKWQDLLEGVRGDDLERLLELHFKERQEIIGELNALSSRLEDLEGKSSIAKAHLGLVRFDAFEDVSGAQSFALALFDDRGDGAVISALVGRTDCRVYCKPLLSGRSERDLSQEERRAIENAKSKGAKSVVS